MQRHEIMLIQWECQQLLNRVTNLTDSARWDELASCYTEDACLFRPSDPTVGIVGRRAILDSFTQRETRLTCHFLTNSVFDVISPTAVRAVSKVLLVAGPAADKRPVSATSRLLAGSFFDTLSRVDGEWLIARREGSVELNYCYENGNNA